MRIKTTTLVLGAGLAALAASPAFAVTAHRHVHRHHMLMDVSHTAAPVYMPVAPYYYDPGYDDPALDAPWDPFFGRGRAPTSGSGEGGG